VHQATINKVRTSAMIRLMKKSNLAKLMEILVSAHLTNNKSISLIMTSRSKRRTHRKMCQTRAKK